MRYFRKRKLSKVSRLFKDSKRTRKRNFRIRKRFTITNTSASRKPSSGGFPFIAHSADPEKGVMEPQLYENHVLGVREISLKELRKKLASSSLCEMVKKALYEILELAVLFHDLGKLFPKSQAIMYAGHPKDIKMINHVDAGTAYALSLLNIEKKKKQSKQNWNYLWVAILINAHHRGLLNKIKNPLKDTGEEKEYYNFNEYLMNLNLLRDDRIVLEPYPFYSDYVTNASETVAEFTDRQMDYLLDAHRKCVGDQKESLSFSTVPMRDYPEVLRILLGCLAKGDYENTSSHYENRSQRIVDLPIRASKRMAHHMEKYNNLPTGDTARIIRRNEVRKLVHKDCEEIDLTSKCYLLSAYPGFGKNHSGDYLGLRLCEKNGHRGIIKIAPYNNILLQNVQETGDLSVLPGERKAEIIGEHYQDANIWGKALDEQMDYRLLKYYNQLWECPIMFASAIQLFETMASNRPGKCRKIPQFAGKVIIIDEFHTVVPPKMLRQTLLWLKQLIDYHGCSVIFMSGSSVKFWEINEFQSCGLEVQEVLSSETQQAMDQIENDRIRISRMPQKITKFSQLINIVIGTPGPRVVVFNTILSASIFANHIRLIYGRDKVEYISTSLTPKNRAKAYNRIKNRLDNPEDDDWILVATSCIETGVNFSFRTGFRENSCLLSTLQLGGRVNRSSEYECCDVFVFNMDHDAMGTTNNPAFNAPIRVQNALFAENMIGYEFCTEAIKREVLERNKHPEYYREVEFKEKDMNYGRVNDLFRIIATGYKTVVVNPDLIEKINNEEVVNYKELIENSVQMFFTKLNRNEYNDCLSFVGEDNIPRDKYKEANIKAPKEFNIWTGEYDPNFLGYMKEILRSLGYDVD